jgi:hypothetical protein
VVNVDAGDRVASSCRTVLVRIASDRTTRPGVQHATVAEPHAHGVGNTIVAVFQAGRFRDGAAVAIGWATSRDGGRTWRDGLLPGRGPFTRASDAACGSRSRSASPGEVSAARRAASW